MLGDKVNPILNKKNKPRYAVDIRNEIKWNG